MAESERSAHRASRNAPNNDNRSPTATPSSPTLVRHCQQQQRNNSTPKHRPPDRDPQGTPDQNCRQRNGHQRKGFYDGSPGKPKSFPDFGVTHRFAFCTPSTSSPHSHSVCVFRSMEVSASLDAPAPRSSSLVGRDGVSPISIDILILQTR